MNGTFTRISAMSAYGKTLLAATVLVTGAVSGAAMANAAPADNPLTPAEQTLDPNTDTRESAENNDTRSGPTGENNDNQSGPTGENN
ncbi:MAG: hypothetical protein NVS2B15_10300 [Pseudarthrobacter sp.]